MSNKDLLKKIENSSKNIEDKDENAEEKIKDIIGKNILMYNIESLSLNINKVEYINDFLNQENEKENENENENENNDIKKDCVLFILYYLLEFSAFFINLVGVYEIIIIMNSLFEIIKQDIFFRFTNTKKITFHEALIQLSLRDIQEKN